MIKQLLFFLMLLCTVSVFAQPANDNCADAEAIGEVTAFSFSTELATTDGPNHPDDCTSAGSTPDSIFNDIWYAYTPTFTGWVEWTMCGTASFDTKIAVYGPAASCPVADGDLYVCSEDATNCAGATSAVSFEVSMGETYLLRLGGYGDGAPGESGTGTFAIAETDPPPAGPANDNCADAVDVTLGIEQAFITTSANTDGPDHPSASCFSFGNDLVNTDVWYHFVAPNTATIEVSTCDMAFFDTRLAVYAAAPGDCPVLDEDLVACNDDGAGCTGFTSLMSFDATAGESYLIRVGGYTAGDQGEGTFSLTEIIPPDPPANDDCATAPEPITVVSEEQASNFEGLVLGTTANGTQDGDVPTCSNLGEFFDVWYTFNSGVDTTLELRFSILTEESGFSVEIHTDCATPEPDIANGGILDTTCFLVTTGSEFLTQQINGFPGVPTDYYVRVSTRITTDVPGDFSMFLIGTEVEVVGNEELYQLENVRLFPNPVNNSAQVELDLESAANVKLEVINTVGQSIRFEDEGQLPSGRHLLTLATYQLSPGIYFLKVTADDKQHVMKFIKE
jgi:hypothetical protein